MKKNFLAFLRMFVFAALMPSLALSLVSCDPDNGVEDAVEDALVMTEDTTAMKEDTKHT